MTDPRTSRLLWLLYGLLMLLLAVYEGINAVIGSPRFAPWEPFTWEVSSVGTLAFLWPQVVRFERWMRVDSRPRWRAMLAHLAAALVFCALHVGGMVAVRKLVYAIAGSSYVFVTRGSFFIEVFYELQKDLISYGLALLVGVAMRELRIRRVSELRAQELAAQLTSARLAHLTAQIEPHFLFNSLNAISNRMHEDVAAADRMISQLGDLLRAVYQADDQPLVPLARELRWLASYAAMMSERFRGQLCFQVQADPDLEDVRVPRLLLQPLVENALRHGLAEGRGRLEVEVRREGERLRCTVRDDGAGLPEGPVIQGTGLANIARRLELLFPQNHCLEIRRRVPGGVEVSVSFPVSP